MLVFFGPPCTFRRIYIRIQRIGIGDAKRFSNLNLMRNDVILFVLLFDSPELLFKGVADVFQDTGQADQIWGHAFPRTTLRRRPDS